jgi:hypothetical protein
MFFRLQGTQLLHLCILQVPADGPVVGIVAYQLLLHVRDHVRILQLFPSFIEVENTYA